MSTTSEATIPLPEVDCETSLTDRSGVPCCMSETEPISFGLKNFKIKVEVKGVKYPNTIQKNTLRLRLRAIRKLQIAEIVEATRTIICGP